MRESIQSVRDDMAACERASDLNGIYQLCRLLEFEVQNARERIDYMEEIDEWVSAGAIAVSGLAGYHSIPDADYIANVIDWRKSVPVGCYMDTVRSLALAGF